MKSIIDLRQLGMHYDTATSRIQVLSEINLTVLAGERIAVVGPSGSGKTTLLLLLAGLEQPTQGSVILDGVPLAGLDSDGLADLRRDRLGIVFQSFHLIPSLSALDNVAIPLEIAGQPNIQARAREVLGRVGLGARLDHYPAQLSGGEQQRVAIARALVHEPRLVVCDEPTSALDQDTGRRVMELLREVAVAPGRALVIVTHDSRTYHFADRIARMNDGAIVGVDAPSAASR